VSQDTQSTNDHVTKTRDPGLFLLLDDRNRPQTRGWVCRATLLACNKSGVERTSQEGFLAPKLRLASWTESITRQVDGHRAANGPVPTA
jgi:hypothetical protein